MLRIALCDDEKIHHLLFQDSLEAFRREYGEEIHLTHFYTAEELLTAKFTYDILFLDIGLGTMKSGQEADGISVGIQLRRRGCPAAFIILTARGDRYRDAYKAGVVRYLEKPVKQSEFNEALIAAIQLMHSRRCAIRVKVEGGYQFVSIFDILYILNFRRKRYLRLSESRTLVSSLTWEELMAQLPRRLFAFVQMSYLINFHHLTGSTGTSVLLSNGEEISISRNYKKDFEEAYSQYVERLAREARFIF